MTNDIRQNTYDFGMLKDFAGPKDIEVKYTFESGMEYILNSVVEKQKHLDFIVVSRSNGRNIWEFGNDDSNIHEFAIWLRNLNLTYSADNFQVSSIPLVLDDKETYHRSLFVASFKNKYYDLITNLSAVNEHIASKIIALPLNGWLNTLADELDRADLDTGFNFNKSLIPKKDTFDTKILSSGFFQRAQGLNYVWVGDNIDKLYVDADLFKKMLDRSCRNRAKRNEKEFHHYLLSNKGILIGEEFYDTIYEHHFYYQMSRRYVEPDFINLTYSHSHYLPQVFEVKLPNQSLVDLKTGAITSYLRKSLDQVGEKYTSYFSDLEHNLAQIKGGLMLKGNVQEELKRDYSHLKFNYTLLIGRHDQKEENEAIINKHLDARGFRIDITTYDELLAKYQAIYNRVKRFGLR